MYDLKVSGLCFIEAYLLVLYNPTRMSYKCIRLCLLEMLNVFILDLLEQKEVICYICFDADSDIPLLQAIMKKRPSRNINVQNFWLYIFGMIFNAIAIVIQDFDAVVNK